MPSADKFSTCLFYKTKMNDENEKKTQRHNEGQKKPEMNTMLIRNLQKL